MATGRINLNLCSKEELIRLLLNLDKNNKQLSDEKKILMSNNKEIMHQNTYLKVEVRKLGKENVELQKKSAMKKEKPRSASMNDMSRTDLDHLFLFNTLTADLSPSVANSAATETLRKVVLQGEKKERLLPHHDSLNNGELKSIYEKLISKENRAELDLDNYISQRSKDESKYKTSFNFFFYKFDFGYSKTEKLDAAKALKKYVHNKSDHKPSLLKEHQDVLNNGNLKTIYKKLI